MAFNWTKGQALAISAQNPVVVSAAAGSGKTAVLVERIIRKIMNENMDIDRFLVVTFTEAAAGEMKEKITSALYAKLAQNPDDKHIQRQLIKIGGAHIETVHSFCMSVIKRYFHLADLPSKFRIADENEIVPLKNEIYGDLLDKWYETHLNDDTFAELVEQTSGSRSDEGLLDIIKEIFSKAESFPVPAEYERFALEQLRLCADGKIFESSFGRYLLDEIVGVQSAVNSALEAIESAEPQLAAKYSKWTDVLREIDIKSTYGYDKLLDTLLGVELPSKPSIRKTDVLYLSSNILWKSVEPVKKQITKAAEAMYCGEKYIVKDAERTYRLVKMLFEMVNDFDSMYSAEKRKRGIADFADLEHFAIKILLAENGGKTPAAEELSLEFDEIYVDEYQDTNELQEKLFELVSRQGNIFCVGDIKQSIYRFRNANPSLFINKLQKTPVCESAQSFGKIALADNFRSRRAIIDSVNCIFDRLMSFDVGDSGYGKGERLEFGASYYSGDDACAEFDLIVSDYEDGRDAQQIQAAHIARRVHEMIASKMPVTDKESGMLRPVCAEDIAIMARSGKNFALLASELEKYGISAVGQSREDFFGREEVMTVCALLKAVNNPTDEVALVASMVSPVFAFTPDELVSVRLCLKNGSYYDALTVAAGGEGELAKKCGEFLSTISALSKTAVNMPADRFLQVLYERTAYPAIVLAQSGGQVRYDNLMTLIKLAKSYEDSGFKGVFYFNLYLDSLRENKSTVGDKDAPTPKGAVKIMTFHKSKGLEFPVVFLAFTEYKFSTIDARKRLLCDKELGIAMKVKDFDTLADYSTAMREIIALKNKNDSRAEEMRLLYVALTRAKEKLVVCASAKSKKNGGLVGLDSSVFEEKFSTESVRGASNPAQWLLSVLQHHPSAAEYCDTAGIDFDPQIDKSIPWRINVLGASSVTAEIKEKAQEKPEFDEALYNRIAESLDFEIEYGSPVLPSKMPVSKIKEEAVNISPEASAKYSYNRPAFMYEGQTLTGAERGTAMHTFMQFADYSRLSTALGIELEKERLVKEQFITAEQAAACDEAALIKFADSKICKRILESPRVLREKRFAIMLPSADVAEFMGITANQDDIFVQGIFDCVFFEDGVPVILDYKTDRVRNMEELKERYAVQLRVYARAAEEIFGVKPEESVIYSLTLNDETVI